jgi:hypothetical protein
VAPSVAVAATRLQSRRRLSGELAVLDELSIVEPASGALGSPSECRQGSTARSTPWPYLCLGGASRRPSRHQRPTSHRRLTRPCDQRLPGEDQVDIALYDAV